MFNLILCLGDHYSVNDTQSTNFVTAKNYAFEILFSVRAVLFLSNSEDADLLSTGPKWLVERHSYYIRVYW